MATGVANLVAEPQRHAIGVDEELNARVAEGLFELGIGELGDAPVRPGQVRLPTETHRQAGVEFEAERRGDDGARRE